MKMMVILLTIFLSFSNIEFKSYSCSSYILVQQGTNVILEGRDIYKTQSVASVSKIMTAILVIENYDLFETITIDESVQKAYGSSIYLQQNDRITVMDLLYGLMLRSGNDAALCLSMLFDDFVGMMNQKAKELNMEYTTFSNPSGLDEEDEGNVSCVYDMALLMSYALDNDVFREIIGCRQYKRLDGKGQWTNKNKLLFQYDDCIGGKTGYTKKAGRTLVTAARKKDMELICVTFKESNDFQMHQDLYETYFKKHEYFYDLDTF